MRARRDKLRTGGTGTSGGGVGRPGDDTRTFCAMGLLRGLAIALPQVLLILLAGGYFDLLGGWNHTDAAGLTLVALFIAAPVVAAVWLVAVGVGRIRRRRRGEAPTPIWPAALVLAEALALDLLILSNLTMH